MDPVVLEGNKLITVVGEVVGSSTIKIDQVEIQVPKLEVKYITVWDRDRLEPYAGFGYPYSYGRGYRDYYGYPLNPQTERRSTGHDNGDRRTQIV